MASTKKTRSADKVPAGFREIDNAMAGFWKPTVKGQTIQGVVGAAITTKGAEGKPNTFYTLAITDVSKCEAVESKDGEPLELQSGDMVGVGGAILVSFLAPRVGQEVYLIYKGLGAKKPGKNPAKLFATYAKEYDPETGEIPE